MHKEAINERKAKVDSDGVPLHADGQCFDMPKRGDDALTLFCPLVDIDKTTPGVSFCFPHKNSLIELSGSNTRYAGMEVSIADFANERGKAEITTPELLVGDLCIFNKYAYHRTEVTDKKFTPRVSLEIRIQPNNERQIADGDKMSRARKSTSIISRTLGKLKM